MSYLQNTNKIGCFLIVGIVLGLVWPFPSLAQTDTDCSQFTDPTEKQLCQSVVDLTAQQAPGPWYNPNLIQFQAKVFGDTPPNEIFGERYVFAQINWIINSIFSLVLPRTDRADTVFALHDLMTILKQNPTGALSPTQTLALGPAALLPAAISFPYQHPPASGIDQVKRTVAKVVSVPSASAQGLGYSKLATAGGGTINAIWTASRNTAYLFSIVLLIAAGFMVMFRTKISPQAVVTVQMMIPKLAITLVLITFSYAIVGFVIDMIYVSIVAIFGFFSLATSVPGLGNIISTAPGSLNTSILAITNAPTNYISNTFLGMYIALTWNIINMILSNTAWAMGVGAIPFVGPLLSAFPLINVMSLGFSLAMVIWALWGGLQIVITLFITYLQLVLYTILGPLHIMLDLVPGKRLGFIPWFKCIVGCASVFVMTAIVALLAQLVFNFPACNNWGAAQIAGQQPQAPPPRVGPGGGGHPATNAPVPFVFTNPVAPAPPTTCPTTPMFGITNGIFSNSAGFTLPFISRGGDTLVGDITNLGGSLGGMVPSAFLSELHIFLERGTKKDQERAVFAFISGLLNQLGNLFLIVGFINLTPSLITWLKSRLCTPLEPDIRAILEPIQTGIKKVTGVSAPQIDLGLEGRFVKRVFGPRPK